MHTARVGLGTQRGTAIALLREVGKKTGIAGPILMLTGLLATACSDRLTEPKGQAETGSGPAFSLTGCPGCLQDNFTDADGTALGSHVPDGGSVPFAWQLTDSDPTVAQIQNNAVGYDQPTGWIYLTSVAAGDVVELEVEVFAPLTVQTDVAAVLRANPTSPTFYKGYTVYWLIYPNGGSDIAIDRLSNNLLFQTFTTTPTSTGLHTFKAEFTADGLIRAYVDGVLAATAHDPNPLPAGRAGMSLFNSSTPSSVRITSFVARPPCPPTGDPVLDDPANLAAFDSSFQAGNPNATTQTDRKEHLRAGYRFPDGHVESYDLTSPFATNCSDSVSVPLTAGEGKLAWFWHSHPFVPHEVVTQCGQKIYDPPLPQYPAMPSKPDWMSLDAINNALFANGEIPIAGYIYDKEQWYRMNPNIPGQQPTNSFIHGKRSACR